MSVLHLVGNREKLLQLRRVIPNHPQFLFGE